MPITIQFQTKRLGVEFRVWGSNVHKEMKPLTTCIIQINLYEFGRRLTSPFKIMSICNQIFCKEIFNRKLWSYIKLTQLVKIDVLKKTRILTQRSRGEKDGKKRILFSILVLFHRRF